MEKTSQSSKRSGGSATGSTTLRRKQALFQAHRHLRAITATLLLLIIALLASLGVLFFAPREFQYRTIAAVVSIAGGCVAVFGMSKARVAVKNLSRLTKQDLEERSELFHDVRNNLAVIKMDAEVALTETETKDLKDSIARMSAEADKINAMLD